ncbi:MAG: squalene/phytoene synthase family protein [Elusimicrobia bacterium]|nr:squalene/phytoene synthase family protein [Elusimicrobiota bacterium]
MKKEINMTLPKHINDILKDVSRSLYLSINIFPYPIKSVMGIGYILCRAADTIVDCPDIHNDLKYKTVKLFHNIESAEVRNELSGVMKDSAAKIKNPKEKSLMNGMAEIFDFYAALPKIYRDLVTEIVDGIAHGMEIDILSFPFKDKKSVFALQTEAELEKYCAYIGGVPGIFWAKLYGLALREKNTNMTESFVQTKDAKSIGEGLQITNILKDMAHDLRMGRCYIPQEDLKSVNLSPQLLLEPINKQRLEPIIFKWIGWAINKLDVSEKFLASIPKMEFSMRAAMVWPVFWAMDTLSEIVKGNPLDLLSAPKIKRSKIYSAIMATPPILLSNTAFARGYRFRRETLIVSMFSKNKIKY